MFVLICQYINYPVHLTIQTLQYQEKMNQSDSMRKMTITLQESEQGSEKWTMECQILKDQLALKETQLAKYMEEIKESQSKIFKCNERTEKLSELDSTDAKLHSLQEDVKKYENLFVKEQCDNVKMSKLLAKLTEENGYLKGSMNKEMLLEEQVSSLETEVRYLRNVAKSKAEIEVERDSMKEKLKQWLAVAIGMDSQLTSPHSFTVFLSQMQTQLVQMRHENTTLSCRLAVKFYLPIYLFFCRYLKYTLETGSVPLHFL